MLSNPEKEIKVKQEHLLIRLIKRLLTYLDVIIVPLIDKKIENFVKSKVKSLMSKSIPISYKIITFILIKVNSYDMNSLKHIHQRDLCDYTVDELPNSLYNLLYRPSKRLSNIQMKLLVKSLYESYVTQRGIQSAFDDCSKSTAFSIYMRRLFGLAKEQAIQGKALYDILQNHDIGTDILLPDYIVNLLHEAEKQGSVAPTLQRILDNIQLNIRIKSKIRKAMVYPLILSFFLIASIMIIGIYVTPIIAEIMEVPLERLPQNILICWNISQVILNPSKLIILVLAIICVIWIFRNSHGLLYQLHYLVTKLPKIGTIVLHYNLLNFFYQLNLLNSNTSAAVAVFGAVNAVSNMAYRKILIISYSPTLNDNKPFIVSSDRCILFDDNTRYELRIGAENSRENETFKELAYSYEMTLNNSLDAIEEFITPIMLIIIVTILATIFLPVLSLMSTGFGYI